MNHPVHIERCQFLPPEFIQSCELFAQWGWNSASPKNVRYKRVECPERFKEWVSGLYGEEGVAHLDARPTTTTTTTATTSTTTATNGTSTTSTTVSGDHTTSSSFSPAARNDEPVFSDELGNYDDGTSSSSSTSLIVPVSIGAMFLLFSCAIVYCVKCCRCKRVISREATPELHHCHRHSPRHSPRNSPRHVLPGSHEARHSPHHSSHHASHATPLTPKACEEFEL